MTLVRLYGRETGNGSLAVVTRGFERALKQAEIFAGFYGIDTADSYGDELSSAGSNARHAVYTGPLGGVGKMFEAGRHEHHWVMIAPNSDQLPRALVAELKRYQEKHSLRFLAPSQWAAGVVRSFIGDCMAVPHGVTPEFQTDTKAADEVRMLYQAGTFRALHFSTSDRQRKGTIELLQAWQILQRDGALRGARLLCVLDYAAKLALDEALSEGAVEDWSSCRQTVTITDRGDLTPAGMASTLALAHVVCQPSRGEGFGLIPLESLCVGTPIVATTATGHSEYLSLERPPGGAVLITPGLDAPIDDLPGSQAPFVTPGSIAQALKKAREDWPALHALAQKEAPRWQSTWSWEASLGPLVFMLRLT